jgi:mono/diheme cytochrome c family protein
MTGTMERLLSIFLVPLLISSCLSGKEESSGSTDTNPRVQNEALPEKVSFEELKGKILKPYCIDCHHIREFNDESGVQKYVVPGDAGNSVFYQVIKDGSMPKYSPPLSTEELEFVRSYIESLKSR